MRYAISSLFAFTCLLLATGCGDDGSTTDTGIGADGGEDGAIDGATDGGADTGTAMCDGRPTENPSPRGEVKGIYDANRDRIVIFGGNVQAPVMCSPRYEQVAELWAFELDCNNWRRIEASGGPSGRSRTAIAHDTMRDRMIVFGGMEGDPFVDAQRFNDVWAFDLEAGTWEELVATGDIPTRKGYAAAVYDEAKDRLLVHGGDPSGFNGIDELHALDLATNTWSAIMPETRPSPRLYQGAIIRDGEMVIFGGASDFSNYLNDIWAFDMTADTWRMVAGGGAAGAPPTRFGGEAFYDAAGDRLITFGGHDATALGNDNNVDAYDFAASAWASVRPGDTLNGTPIGACDFPNDFTLPEDGMPTPERRQSYAYAQSADTAFITMGKTDCGNINDVWSLDLSAGTWETLRAPTGGEACNRSGSTTCRTLCD